MQDANSSKEGPSQGPRPGEDQGIKNGRAARRVPWGSPFDLLFRLELFSYQPVPQFYRGSYGTLLGVICSLLVFGGLMVYCAVTFSRFLEDNVSVSLETVIDLNETMTPVPLMLEMPFIADPTFFELAVQHRFSPEPGARTTRDDVPYTALGRDRVLINMSTGQHMSGNCRITSCFYIRITIYPCENGTTPLPGNSSCQSLDRIGQVLDTNYLDLTMFLSVQGFGLPYTTQTSLKLAASFRKQMIFDVHEVRLNPDFYRQFQARKFVELHLARESFDIDRIPRILSGSDRELSKLDFMLSSTRVHENINPQTFLDLVGSWAAFFGALMAVFGTLVTLYNRRRFYIDHPSWDHFDERFARLDNSPSCAEKDTTGEAAVASVYSVESGAAPDGDACAFTDIALTASAAGMACDAPEDGGTPLATAAALPAPQPRHSDGVTRGGSHPSVPHAKGIVDDPGTPSDAQWSVATANFSSGGNDQLSFQTPQIPATPSGAGADRGNRSGGSATPHGQPLDMPPPHRHRVSPERGRRTSEVIFPADHGRDSDDESDRAAEVMEVPPIVAARRGQAPATDAARSFPVRGTWHL